MTARPKPESIQLVGDTTAAATMLQPLRLEILESLGEADSATGLARRLGMPRQRLNYHLRKLESAGLVDFVRAERKGGCLERFYQARARYFLVAPDATGPVTPPEPRGAEKASLADRFSWAHLVSLVGKALRDLATLRRRADEAGQELVTLSLQTEIRFASPRALADFRDDLTDAVGQLVKQYHDEGAPKGRPYQLFAGSYPTITPTVKKGAAAGRVPDSQ